MHFSKRNTHMHMYCIFKPNFEWQQYTVDGIGKSDMIVTLIVKSEFPLMKGSLLAQYNYSSRG